MQTLIKLQLLTWVLGAVGLGSVAVADCGPDARASIALDLLTESGVQGGLIVHLGCGDGKLTAALRAGDRYWSTTDGKVICMAGQPVN